MYSMPGFDQKNLLFFSVGSGTESDSDDSVPELEEQDSAQTQTQQAQVRVQPASQFDITKIITVTSALLGLSSSVMINTVTFVLLS